MGWFKRFMARRGNIPSTAKWACKQYLGFKKMRPQLDDKELIQAIIDLRYGVLPLNQPQEELLRGYLPRITSIADLAYMVLAVENDDRTATSPFRDEEWEREAMRTIWGVVHSYGLEEVEFDFPPSRDRGLVVGDTPPGS